MLTIRKITDSNDFLKLAPVWNQLLARSNSNNIFLTWEWISNWWQVYGQGKDLFVLGLKNDEGSLIAIAPLYIRKKKFLGGFFFTEVRFLGTGEDVSPDYLDFIIARGSEAEAIDAFMKHLTLNNGWDVINLTDMLSNSSANEILKKKAGEMGLVVRQSECATCPYIVLPSSWEEYVGTLSANARYNVKRKIKNIERDFKTRYFVWEDFERLDDAMERLAQLHNKRWEEKECRHSFSSNEYVSFHKAVSKDFAKQGWLHLSCLELNGEIVGMLYDYRYGDKISYYQAGFDPVFHKYSPGLVLRAYVIRRAIEEGMKEIDLLKGAYDFKYMWTGLDRSTVNITVGRQSTASKLYFLNTFKRQEIKAAVKRALPDSVIRLVKG
jgi:CelD/BcsL family acetyltransferase involved in cellulose biosynthesis